ncbi:putative 6-methylsalicylic acid synthase [Rosellinia necatrix]|uniref:6-methylsalicylic acid synthase n=1 Tax=Rosellinia necatrix TaxID=77044 RepID=A0A1W2TJC3_ROSNE|nr:putative 6-methylsalicylic acid synthase [Rosellinia necatrix]
MEEEQSSFQATTPLATSVNDNLNQEGALRDVAIIGMACRVPGGNNSPNQLWDFLLRKGDAAGEIPPMRWEPYHSRHPRNAEVLKKTTTKGYFLDRLEDFDAAFFGIAPREAEQIDPQQRIALEVAWEALEDAGISPDHLSGSDTAVFMGVDSDDYGRLMLEDLQNIEAHMGVGTAYCGVPGRISYHFNLMGPSIAVDAACASSLVAVHQARQALLAGETRLAIAGGVNALIGPALTRVLDKAGALSADGKCRSFDDSASGYGRGEGTGIVVLKRLDNAIADGDQIHGILKGTAVCADGQTAGIMAPSAAAQCLVARKALKDAKITAESISYVEAHATSTPLGDPTEVNAISQVYGTSGGTDRSYPCTIGSIKSNIGHLEAGAGVLGLIKAVKVVQHGLVPGQVNLEKPNSEIDWDRNGLQVHKEATELIKRSGSPARAAVASYGYSGTVSHAILEASPSSAPLGCEAIPEPDDSPVLLLISGPQENRLPEIARLFARWLQSPGPGGSLQEVATTLASRRAHHRFRASIVAASRDEATSAFERLAEGLEDPFTIQNRISSDGARKGVVWVFSGHGSHWPSMGKELYESNPTFAGVVRELEPIVQQELDFSLIEALLNNTVERTDEIQVMTFCMHVGLAAVLLQVAGAPSAVVGHSLGETAASVVAGVLTLREGALFVCRRARLFRRVIGHGGMALVGMSAQKMKSSLGEFAEVDVAVDASPESCVIAGSSEALSRLSTEMAQTNVHFKRVRCDVPFHSRLLGDLVAPLRQSIDGQICPMPSRIPLYSTSAADSRSKEHRDIEYWVGNMIRPVLLRRAIKSIAEDGYRAFVEVSGHPIILNSINETLESEGLTNTILLPTMTRNQPAMKSILNCVGKLHCFGCRVAYTDPHSRPWHPGVPRTSWSHEPYWRRVTAVPLGQVASHRPGSNNLLGSRTIIWGTENVLFQTHLEEANRPYPGSHPLHGSEIVPAAILINTFLRAIESVDHCLKNVSLKVPVVVSPPRELQILLDGRQISLRSRLAEATGRGSWLVNTTSDVAPIVDGPPPITLDLTLLKERLSEVLPHNFSADYLANLGVPEMALPWKVLDHVANDDEMLAKVDTNPDELSGIEDLGASIMDAATSIASTVFHRQPLLRMPTSIGYVRVFGSMTTLKVGYVYCKRTSKMGAAADIFICDENGRVMVLFQAMAFAGIEADQLSRKSTNGLVHRIAWVPAPFAETPLAFRHIVFLVHDSIPGYILDRHEEHVVAKGYTTSRIREAADLQGLSSTSIVIHFAHNADSTIEGIAAAASGSCENLVSAAKVMAASGSTGRLFSLIDQTYCSALGSAPLYGLSRIMKSELPHIWGGLFELEKHTTFPLTGLKYIQGQDVVRYEDDIARTARLRPFPEAGPRRGHGPSGDLVHPSGTYLITGGLGALGLETARWLCASGARRLILVSRRKLPPRREWKESHESWEILRRITELENIGASVHVIAVDISKANADVSLAEAIDNLSLPAVRGVIHAAGVLYDQRIEEITKEAFDSVLAPKINGALHLDRLFPPGSLDFFTLFSSCGQLLGFPGQASYASANSFLDALAERRRSRGDNALSILWTSWRGLGMAASTEYINAELEARGISDITTEEAFMGWERLFHLDTGHGVIMRALALDSDEQPPHTILQDIATRRPAAIVGRDAGQRSSSPGNARGQRPTSGHELEAYIRTALTSAVAATLGITDPHVDPSLPLSEMGMDSVMTVSFRTKVQKSLKVKMAPTLVWKCPTLDHLVKHFMTVAAKEGSKDET